MTTAELTAIACEVARDKGVDPEGMKVHLAGWLSICKADFLVFEQARLRRWSILATEGRL